MESNVTVPVCQRCAEPLPLGRSQHVCKAPKEKRPALEAWHRPLEHGRSEILCRAPGYHVRVSGPDEQVWEAVEMFERWTGMEIQSERRPRRVKSPPEGQITMFDLLPSVDTNELEMEGKNGED